MPKKTKKQKIIAEYHRRLKLLQNQPLTYPQTPIKETENKIIENIIKKEEKDKPEELTKDINQNTKFFLMDFKKSFFLTVAIITLEIIFYFATIKNYLKLN